MKTVVANAIYWRASRMSSETSVNRWMSVTIHTRSTNELMNSIVYISKWSTSKRSPIGAWNNDIHQRCINASQNHWNLKTTDTFGNWIAQKDPRFWFVRFLWDGFSNGFLLSETRLLSLRSSFVLPCVRCCNCSVMTTVHEHAYPWILGLSINKIT